MGRITDALARAEGRARPVPAPDDALHSWGIAADSQDVLSTWQSEAVEPLKVTQPPVRSPAPESDKPLGLAGVPADVAASLVASESLPAHVREQYRTVAASLHHAQRDRGLRVLMVASSLPDEGKTLVATNVALTLSRSFGRRVLLVDCDLRKPSIQAVFGLPASTAGLTDVLRPQGLASVAPVHILPTLWVLPAGLPEADSMRLMTSGALPRFLKDAAKSFDWVVLDTPPIGLLADAHVLASMADGVLFVVEACKTPYDVAQKSVDLVGRDRIVGTVLNRAPASELVSSGYDYHKDYYSAAGQPTEGSDA